MERNSQIRRAVRQTLVMSAVATAAALPAHAQEADEVDTIVVTGSRIAQPNLETTSPVTQVTADDIARAGRDQRRRPGQPAAAGLRCAERQRVERRDRHGDGQPARPGLARTLVLVDGRRMPYGGVTGVRSRPEPDPGRDGRARRSADRRRFRRVRLGRDRRRRQLHHEEGLRGRAVRCHVRPLPAQQRLRRPWRGEAPRRDRGPRCDEPGAVPAAGRQRHRRRSARVQRHDGREHRRRPRQHHRVRRRARQQGSAAERPRLLGVLAGARTRP